jgi:hypothetical protein
VSTGDQGWRRSSGEDRTLKSQLARDWAQAVASLAYRPTTRAEIEIYLRGHLETLHDALLAQPFTPEPGREIGASLVRIHLTKPETVEETLVLLSDRLLGDLGLDTYTFQPQLNRLLGALAQGFTRALRDRALSDLEQVWAAALRVNLGPLPTAEPGRPPPPKPAGPYGTAAAGLPPADPFGPLGPTAPPPLAAAGSLGAAADETDGPPEPAEWHGQSRRAAGESGELGPPGTVAPAGRGDARFDVFERLERHGGAIGPAEPPDPAAPTTPPPE